MTLTPQTRPRHRRRPSAVHRRRRAAVLLVISAALMIFACTRAPAATASYEAAATLPQVVGNITTWVVGILAAVATMFVTIGGLRYVMAGGDPSEVEKAKRALKSAMFGYGLAMLAPTLVTVLQGLVGAR
jgi:uncharacterized integral membrane protein